MSQDADVDYIESDLTGISAEKAQLIAILRARYALADHHNLSFPAINAVEMSQLREAVESLRPDAPLAVVNEGLFPYLSPAEMRDVARNIRDLDHTRFFNSRRSDSGVGTAARISPHRLRGNRSQHV